MSNFQQICGIDIGKSSLDLSYLTNNYKEIKHRYQLDNKLSSIDEWFSKQDKEQETLYVMEHTGTYGSKLLHYLLQKKQRFSLVSPYRSKSFMQTLGITNKNDRQAADSLAKMGQLLDLKQYTAPSEAMQKRKQLLHTISAFEKQERMLLNQLEAMAQLVILEPSVKVSTEAILSSVQKELNQLNEQLKLEQQDREYQKKKKLAVSVIGIGEKTADAMLLATNCFQDFPDGNKVSKFFGLTPSSHYSGSSVHKKGRITKHGNSYVRSLLYNCTRSAIRFNPMCRELFLRLRKNGKPYNVAAVAVMHKLVKQVYACVTKENMFDKNYKHIVNKNID